MQIKQVEELPGRGIVVITDQRISQTHGPVWSISETVQVKLANGNTLDAQILGLEFFRGSLESPLVVLLGGIGLSDVEEATEILKVE